MNRRRFLQSALCLLPLPAFARAASLWLPKEKAFVPLTMEIVHQEAALTAPQPWPHSLFYNVSPTRGGFATVTVSPFPDNAPGWTQFVATEDGVTGVLPEHRWFEGYIHIGASQFVHRAHDLRDRLFPIKPAPSPVL